MQEAKAAWEEVGSQFSSLGLKLKEHFAKAAASEAGAAERSDTAARDAMRDALRKLGAALDDAVEAVSGAARDPAITDDLRNVGQSVMNAFHSTFADVSDDLRNAFSRSRNSE